MKLFKTLSAQMDYFIGDQADQTHVSKLCLLKHAAFSKKQKTKKQKQKQKQTTKKYKHFQSFDSSNICNDSKQISLKYHFLRISLS